MITVWKFPLVPTDVQYVIMPEAMKILTVQMQFGMPCVWAMVESGSKKRQVTFWTVGTGNPCPIPLDARYVGTYQLNEGALVFHVFCDGE